MQRERERESERERMERLERQGTARVREGTREAGVFTDMFLTGRPQVVKVGNDISSSLIINTGAPQGCVLSPLLYTLFTHDCVAKHASNSVG